MEQPKSVSKSLTVLNTTILIVAGLSAIGTVYWFWRNNLWRPKVKVNSVDYTKGHAELLVNGKTKKLYVNEVLNAGGEWGLRFAGITTPTNATYYNRIELVRNNLTYSIIDSIE